MRERNCVLLLKILKYFIFTDFHKKISFEFKNKKKKF